jgi:cellulose 1,4-beta-cellobiosidase
VTYAIQSQWATGFVANPVTIRNTGSAPITNWTLTWTFGGNQQITNAWGILITQTGASVSGRNDTWDATIPAGGTVVPGFQATYSGTNARPASFALNGVTCSITP